MKNSIITTILVVIIGAAISYLFKAKKSGQKCIGCPYSQECSGRKHSCDSNK